MSKSRLLKRGYAAVLAIAIFLSVFLMQGAFFVYGEEGSESTNLSDFKPMFFFKFPFYLLS